MPVTELHADARISSSGVFSADQGSILSTNASSKIEWPVEMQFAGLLDRSLSFHKPLQVRLYKDVDSYVAQCSELDQFGYGADAAEALDDLGRTLSEMYFYFSDAEQFGTLGESLKEQYSILRAHIEHRDARAKVA